MGERGWASSETARRYAAYTEQSTLYPQLADRLVELAGLAPGMHVVDLACGTGVVTERILARLGGSGRVLGVDASEAMLAVARARVPGEHVTWACCPGEELARVVDRPADAVLCSSAIWQLSLSGAFAAIRAVLRADGVLAFNVPQSIVPGLFPPATPPDRPPLIQRMLAVAILEHDHVLLPPPAPRQRIPDRASMERLLAEAGLRLERLEVMEVETTPESEADWLRIPVFTEYVLPRYDYPTRMAILDRALEGYRPPAAAPAAAWAFLRCRPVEQAGQDAGAPETAALTGT